MGRRGPAPQPTALKLARGNPGKRPLNQEEPQLPPADLTPPKRLKGRALEEWQAKGPLYLASGTLTMGDLTFFETYCKVVGDEERYTRLVERLGDEAAHQLKYDSHLLGIRAQLKQYFVELGGTPSSRSGVKAKKPTDPADARRKRFGLIGGAATGGTA